MLGYFSWLIVGVMIGYILACLMAAGGGDDDR